MSLAIFFLFLCKNFRDSCDSNESQLSLFGTTYFPTAPYFLKADMVDVVFDLKSVTFLLIS